MANKLPTNHTLNPARLNNSGGPPKPSHREKDGDVFLRSLTAAARCVSVLMQRRTSSRLEISVESFQVWKRKNLTNKQYIYQRCHGKDFIDPQLFWNPWPNHLLKLPWNEFTIYIDVCVRIYMWMLMHHWFHVIDSLCLTPFFFLFSLTSSLFTLGPGVIDVTQDIDALQKDAGLSSMFFSSFRGFELENMFETTTNILLMEEILHQLLRSLSDYLQGFIHSRWLFGISSINM